MGPLKSDSSSKGAFPASPALPSLQVTHLKAQVMRSDFQQGSGEAPTPHSLLYFWLATWLPQGRVDLYKTGGPCVREAELASAVKQVCPRGSHWLTLSRECRCSEQSASPCPVCLHPGPHLSPPCALAHMCLLFRDTGCRQITHPPTWKQYPSDFRQMSQLPRGGGGLFEKAGLWVSPSGAQGQWPKGRARHCPWMRSLVEVTLATPGSSWGPHPMSKDTQVTCDLIFWKKSPPCCFMGKDPFLYLVLLWWDIRSTWSALQGFVTKRVRLTGNMGEWYSEHTYTPV